MNLLKKIPDTTNMYDTTLMNDKENILAAFEKEVESMKAKASKELKGESLDLFNSMFDEAMLKNAFSCFYVAGASYGLDQAMTEMKKVFKKI